MIVRYAQTYKTNKWKYKRYKLRDKIGRSVKVCQDLQEAVTDREQRDKLWYKTAVSGDKLR